MLWRVCSGRESGSRRWLYTRSWHYWWDIHSANKSLYILSVDLEKTLDRVPSDVIWWAMLKLRIYQRLKYYYFTTIYIYTRYHTRYRLPTYYWREQSSNKAWEHVQECWKQSVSWRWVQLGVWCGVGVHQGTVLSPLLFIIVLEALSWECLTDCLLKLLYAYGWVPWGTDFEGWDIEVRDREGRPVCEHVKDKAQIWTYWRSLERMPVLSVLQERVEMQTSVVAACCECIRNRVVSRFHFSQTTRYGWLMENWRGNSWNYSARVLIPLGGQGEWRC